MNTFELALSLFILVGLVALIALIISIYWDG